MPQPVFALLALTSGSYEGAIIRDMRLANEMHRRGFAVRVYWLMERNPDLLAPGIPQSVLARATRYRFRKPSGLADQYGRIFNFVPPARRRRFLNTHPEYIARLMGNLMHVI